MKWIKLSSINCAAVFMVAAASTSSLDVAAQTPAQLARALFEDGVKLRKAKERDAACEKFRASLALVPAVASLGQVAMCDIEDGKLIAAVTGYRRARDVNAGDTHDVRRAKYDKAIAAEIAALQARIPKLRITAPIWPKVFHLTRNGQTVPPEELDTTIDVDPGEHTIVAEAPDYRPYDAKVTLPEGKTQEIQITWSALPAEIPSTRPIFPSAPPPVAPAALPHAATPSAATPPTLRIAGIAAGTLGFVTLGLAAGFGIDTLAKVNKIGSLCDRQSTAFVCTEGSPGVLLHEQAVASQRAAIGLAVAGGVALTGGVVLFFSGTPRAHSAPASGARIHGIVATAAPGRVSVAATW